MLNGMSQCIVSYQLGLLGLHDNHLQSGQFGNLKTAGDEEISLRSATWLLLVLGQLRPTYLHSPGMVQPAEFGNLDTSYSY